MKQVDLGTEFRMKKIDSRSVVIGFLVAVIGFMSMGATNSTFDSITVGEIILKDESLWIVDKEKREILNIAGANDIHALLLYNTEGTPIAAMSQGDDGAGAISVFNDKRKEVVRLSVTSEIDGYIGLFDRYGDLQWGMTGKRK
jgi:hypothetical protein